MDEIDNIIIGTLEEGIVDLDKPANLVFLEIAKLLIRSHATPEDCIEIAVKDSNGLEYTLLFSVETYPYPTVVHDSDRTIN